MATSAEPIRVDVWELRCRFNRGNFWQRAIAGEFQVEERRTRLARPESGQLSQTESCSVYYYDASGEAVARVHYFRRPDGSLGGSGKPDPKMLRVGDQLYRLRSGPDIERQPELAFRNSAVRWIYKNVWRRLKCKFLGK